MQRRLEISREISVHCCPTWAVDQVLKRGRPSSEQEKRSGQGQHLFIPLSNGISSFIQPSHGWCRLGIGITYCWALVGMNLKMRAKISDPSRYENFGVWNILDLQYVCWCLAQGYTQWKAWPSSAETRFYHLVKNLVGRTHIPILSKYSKTCLWPCSRSIWRLSLELWLWPFVHKTAWQYQRHHLACSLDR